MKKTAIILSALLIMGCFAGCAASPMDVFAAKDEAAPMAMADAYNYSSDYEYYEPKEMYSEPEAGGGISDSVMNADAMDKIIYSAYAEVETLEFDETVNAVYELVKRYGGFIESADVTGSDYYTQYYNNRSYREANFTLRVPRDSYGLMTESVSQLGNVTYMSEKADNITMQYNDVQSRLKAYRTEEERLLDMLGKSQTVEEMIAVEERLGEIRYNIESLTSQILNWDSKINYSTVKIQVREVNELTPQVVVAKTFGEQLMEGLTDSLDWLGGACKDIAIFIVSAVPVLILPAVAVVIIVLIIRKIVKRKRVKKQD